MLASNDHYQPFWIWPVAFGGLAAIIGFFGLLNRMVERFFPSTQRNRYRAAMGNALMRVDAVLEPSRDHMVEVREYQEGKEEKEEKEGWPPPRRGRH